MNQTIPITATVAAVAAAIGLMVSIAEKEVTKSAVVAVAETKTATVPTASFLWLTDIAPRINK